MRWAALALAVGVAGGIRTAQVEAVDDDDEAAPFGMGRAHMKMGYRC